MELILSLKSGCVKIKTPKFKFKTAVGAEVKPFGVTFRAAAIPSIRRAATQRHVPMKTHSDLCLESANTLGKKYFSFCTFTR